MPSLRIKLPNAHETIHVLHGTRVTVGRAPDNTIQIPHASISSHHAEFVEVNGKYELRDLHSTNCSYVAGCPVTETSLSEECAILFGAVECEFDPTAPAPAEPVALPRLSPAEARADAAYLESENRVLRDHLSALQRRFDILGSARLSTGRTHFPRHAPEDDRLKDVSSERDDLKNQFVRLRLQTERLQQELTVTIRERDAARQAAESLQTERATLLEQLKQAQIRVQQFETLAAEPPPSPPLPAAPSQPPPRPRPVSAVAPPPPPPGITRKAPEPERPNPARLPDEVRTFREVLALLSTAPGDPTLLAHAGEALAGIAAQATLLDHRALLRLVRGFQGMLRDFAQGAQPPAPGVLRTLRHAGELLTRLIEPQTLKDGRELPPAQVLAVDDDADLLDTVLTSLRSSGLEVSGSASAEEALVALRAGSFDTLLVDLHLPDMSGAGLCTLARELPAYRRTPILFLTVTDTLDKRAETSLSGGNEFIAKPFNVSELVLKVECWALKQQLRLA